MGCNRKILRKAQEQTGSELVAVFSVRDSSDTHYNYYLQPLGFSPESMEEANGKTQLFIYELNKDHKGSVPRIAIAVIPAGERAFKEMEAWILPKRKNEKHKSDCSWVQVVSESETCDWTGQCWEHSPIYDYICGGSPSGNDDGGDDPDWNWPTGGGGGNSSPGSGDGNPDECNPPYGCEDQPEPCNIQEESILNDNQIQFALNDIWEDSGVNQSIEDSQPIEDRREKGGFVINNNGALGFIPFPSDWGSTACSVDPPGDYLNDIPSNLVAIVHSHPFFKDENTTSPLVCGSENGQTNYSSGTNLDDIGTLIAIASELGNFSIKGYIIDGYSIVRYTTIGQIETFERCGY